jgi:hypothetical protein
MGSPCHLFYYCFKGTYESKLVSLMGSTEGSSIHVPQHSKYNFSLLMVLSPDIFSLTYIRIQGPEAYIIFGALCTEKNAKI